MSAVIAIVAVIVIGIVVYLLVRQRQQQQGPDKLRAQNQASTQRASVRGVRLGDVVNFEGREFVVQGSIHYEQDGSVWDEHLLVDGDTKRWMSVEDDEGLEVAIWEKLVDPDLQPGEHRILYGGRNYTLSEQGAASYRSEGTTGTAPTGRYDYFDYEAGEQRLSFERYGQDAGWELSVGRVVPEAALDVYPGTGEPV